MHKGILRIAIVFTAGILNIVTAQASDYKGGYIGGKFGINRSEATGTINAPNAATFAYGVQGGYLQGGYNWDILGVTIGVGAYADFNSYEKHENGVEYGSRAYGMDAKLGLPVGDWLPYGKIGYGYSTATRDLSMVAQKSPNAAVGAEYKIASRWGAIVEYKIDSYSNKDGSILIRNKTFSFGLNYYFDRPIVDQEVAAAVPEFDLGTEPEPEADLDLASEPPPDIGSSVKSSPTIPSTIPSEPESWKILLAGKAVHIEGANFISETTRLMSVVSKELDETAGFAAKYPYAKLEVIGYSDGPAKQSLKLSLGRAEAIRKYLVTKGVAAKRIMVKNKGTADTIGDNKTEEGRAKNRRIEILSVITAWTTLLENKPVHIESTNFVVGTTGTIKLKPKADKELDAVVAFAGKHPEANLEIVGYSDNKSEPALSLELADSVRNYLVTKGVASNRITIKGEGSANLVADNKTKAGRTKNRRVEIRSIAKEQKIPGEANPIPMPSPAPAPVPKPVAVPVPVLKPVAEPKPVAAPALAVVPTPVAALVPVAVPATWKLLLEEKPVLVNIEGTSFDSGSGRPNSHVVEELDEVVGFAGKYPDTELELTGYTDRTGSPELNQKLSFTRAESVKKYLVKKGVSASRITTDGKGPANPVGNNNTKEGRAKNRRVEIHSVTKDEKKTTAGVAAPAPVPVPDQSSGRDTAKPPP